MSWLLGYASFQVSFRFGEDPSWHPGLLSLLSCAVWWPRKHAYPGHHLWLIRVGPASEGEVSGSRGGADCAMLGQESHRSMGRDLCPSLLLCPDFLEDLDGVGTTQPIFLSFCLCDGILRPEPYLSS